MAFTDFNSADEVQTAYQITSQEKEFLHIQDKPVAPFFIQEFEFNQANFDIFSSEASRCEAVIYPLLGSVGIWG